MAHLIAPDYNQRFLLPYCLEDWVGPDHPARFLREFVDQLNLEALGFVMPCGVGGRPAYAPSLLLKIGLYGYFHRIRSSRKLEAACREHLSLLWLTGLRAPDHNPLWRFWRDNRPGLRAVYKQTVRLAVRLGAGGLVLQALDGTKIAAVCNSAQGWSQKQMQQMLAELDAAAEQMEAQISQAGPEGTEACGYRLPEELAQRQALRQQIQQGLAQLEAEGRRYYQPGDPEARRMKVGKRTAFASNAQARVDAQEGVIVACEVSREQTDGGSWCRCLRRPARIGPRRVKRWPRR